MIKVYFAAFLLIATHNLYAATPLVNSQWLNQHKDDANLLIVDLRSKEFFEYAHIPGSVQTDYNLWRQPNQNGIGKMLPTKKHLEKLLSALGATADSHIVLMHSGQSASDLAAATRVYWTLQQIGHRQQSIHDEGIISYANLRLPLQQGPASTEPSEYKIAHMKTDQVTADDIHKNTRWNRIDVRSKAEYLGIYQAAGEKPGTLPGAASLPFDWLTVNGSGQFQKSANLDAIFKSISRQSLSNKADQKNVYFCHTGHRASLSWFVAAELLGDKNAVLYDGSTADWSVRPDLPVDQLVNIQL